MRYSGIYRRPTWVPWLLRRRVLPTVQVAVGQMIWVKLGGVAVEKPLYTKVAGVVVQKTMTVG